MYSMAIIVLSLVVKESLRMVTNKKSNPLRLLFNIVQSHFELNLILHQEYFFQRFALTNFLFCGDMFSAIRKVIFIVINIMKKINNFTIIDVGQTLQSI